MFAFCANAQTSKPKSIIVIDGYFFNEMPVSKQNIAKMHMLQTPNGTMALGLELNEKTDRGGFEVRYTKGICSRCRYSASKV